MKVKLFAILAMVALAGFAWAEDKKAEVILKGELACGKCVLKLEGADKCTLVLTVKDGDKTETYSVVTADKKAEHSCCKAAVQATVTGTISEVDGKKVITGSVVIEKPKKNGKDHH